MTMLEKIIKKALKGGAGIATALALTSAEAQHVYLEASTEGIEWKPGQTYQLTIFADNTSLKGEKTATIFWDLSIPEGVTLTEAVQPKPYYIDDFFSGFEMDRIYNKVKSKGSVRATAANFDPIEGKVILDGPSNRCGVLGVYNFRVNEDAKEGQKNFVLYGTKAFIAGDTQQQEIVVQQRNVGVIKDSVVVICNYNVLDNTTDVRVAGKENKKYKLEASEDLKNWTAVWTNSASGSFAYDDREAALKNKRFYRASEVRE